MRYGVGSLEDLATWWHFACFYARARQGLINNYKNIHHGETLLCVGCGPSIKGLNPSLFSLHPSIYLNSAYEINPSIKSTISYSLVQDHNRLVELSSLDRSLFNACFKTTYKFNKAITNSLDKSDVLVMPKLTLGRGNYIRIPEGLIVETELQTKLDKYINIIGYTVMFSGIQLAIWMGAKTVLLAGYDLKFNTNNMYFNQDRKRFVWIPDYNQHIRPAAIATKRKADELGIDIININPNSNDDVFLKTCIYL